MKLHLVDKINNYDEYYELDNTLNYREVWEKIDKIIGMKKYSCLGFPIPEINEEEKVIRIHWIELFGVLSVPYIEIVEYTEQVIEIFKLQIRQCVRRKERTQR